MDYSQVCQGCIYYIRNKVNGKMYIGKTNNFRRRKNEHFSKHESSEVLKRAYTKYGMNNFEMVSILEIKAINTDILNKCLNWLECFYIKKYNTYNNGYNATLGGDGVIGLVFSEEHRKKLSEANKVSQLGKKLSKEAIEKRTKTFKENKVNRKPILQYDLDGNFIREFDSTVSAVEETKVNKDCILRCLRGKKSRGGHYLWKYKEADYIPQVINPYINPLSPPVYYYTKDDCLIAKFDSMDIASKKTGIKYTKIRNYCSRPTENHRGNYFSYQSPS